MQKQTIVPHCIHDKRNTRCCTFLGLLLCLSKHIPLQQKSIFSMQVTVMFFVGYKIALRQKN